MKFKKNILLLLSIIAISITTIASVFAWYVSSVGIIQDLSDKKLAANASYYESGTGTESDPYIISNARHLYNLAWLQDLGYYDDKIYYFKLKNDIDMSNLKLGTASSASPIPAIGIDKHPFVGVFDGEGYTISNLYVASNFASSNCITPSRIILQEHNDDTFNTTTNNIVSNYNGLFGVIKKFSDSSTSESTSESKVTNFTIAKAKIESSQNTLVGYICGYVNSNLSKVGVANSNLTLASGVTHYSNYPVSKYGLVGDYNEATSGGIEWSNKPGQNDDWGGSIDISSLSKRVTYITNNSTLKSGSASSYPTYTSSDFGTSFYQSPSQYQWDYSTKNAGQYCALEAGTYLPLNVNTSNITESYYSENKKEDILNTNTGYIVGYGSGGNAGPRVTNKLTNSSSSGIKYSIATQANSSDSTDRNTVFSQSNIALFYYDTINKTTNRILDDNNASTTFNSKPSNTSTVNLCSLKLQKYSNVKEQFIDMLDSGTSDTILASKKVTLNGIQIFKLKSSNLSTIDASNIQLNGKTYGSYQFYSGGFNFTLKSSGILTMIVGCYTTSSGHQLPQIYQLQRDSDNKITSKTEIKTIYQDSTGIYYNDTSKGTTIDLSAMTSSQVLLQYCAYYIEMPLMAGDYYFASIDQSNNCPYLLYLDIGANAGDSGESSDTIGTIKDIDFTYVSGEGYALVDVDNGFTLSNVSFNIDGTTTKEVSLYVMRSIKEGNLVYYYFIADDGITITPTGSPNSESTLGEFNKLS